MQKFPHLFGAGQARFIDHVQMPPRGVLRYLLLSATGEEALQCVCADAGLAGAAVGVFWNFMVSSIYVWRLR